MRCVINAFLKSALYAPECQLSLVGLVTGSVMNIIIVIVWVLVVHTTS